VALFILSGIGTGIIHWKLFHDSEKDTTKYLYFLGFAPLAVVTLLATLYETLRRCREHQELESKEEQQEAADPEDGALQSLEE